LREVVVAGTASTYLDIRSFKMAAGSFLPEGDWNRGLPVAVIGSKIKEEIFGAPAVGELIRLGDRRLRIVGVLKSVGQGLGMNTDEVVFVPAAVAQSLFNTNTLFRILVEARSRDEIEAVKREVAAALKARHGGEEDTTVITQDAVLATFDKLLRALTAAVAGIAAISLAVAGILVMNVMLVAVTQRTGEIGLLKALGARGTTIRDAFMAEAAMLSLVGALTGYGLGLFGAFVLRQVYPGVPRLSAGLGGDRGAGHGAVHRPAVRHHAGAARGAARSGAGPHEA
jgi:putative ABC transport system permease protein